MGSHIIDPDGCTIIDRRLASLKNALGALATTHLPIGASLEAQVNLLTSDDNTATHSGLCVYLQNTSTQPLWNPDLLTQLCDWAASQRLARLSIDDHASPLTIFAPTQQQVKFGKIGVTPPPGAFLQATEHGEAALQTAIAEILHGHMHIADLFAGCGSLSLPLIDQLVGLLAVEADSSALAALKAGIDAAGFGGRLTKQKRDLFDLPLLPAEFTKVTAVILDPPRSGAIAQCQQIAQSHITTIAMASCNPASFARDAACLTAAGFRLDWVQPIDQFNHSNHLELVGAFSR
jgi:23S rRNA (uracil1939-C5)-methyltransferase